jgi:hypothetical protein
MVGGAIACVAVSFIPGGTDNICKFSLFDFFLPTEKCFHLYNKYTKKLYGNCINLIF